MSDLLGIIAPHPPIMVPAVGGERSAATDASAASLRETRTLLEWFVPDALVVSSPHAPAAREGFLVRTDAQVKGDLGEFGASAPWSASGDPELAATILAEADAAGLPNGSLEEYFGPHRADHGVLVPISFLDPEGRFPFVGLSLSMLSLDSHVEFGRAVRRAVARLGRRVAFLASGDLSHRLMPDAPAGYSPRAADFDRELIEIVRSGNLTRLLEIDPDLSAAAGECGLRSFLILAGFLGSDAVASRVLSYEGPWGVGYLTAVVGSPEIVARLDEVCGSKGGCPGDPESPHVALARAAIEQYVRCSRVVEPPDDPALQRRAGAFVSLHRGADLRGCIGTIEPSCASLAEEIITMAIQAATQDPRFQALEPDELADLEISVDVLGSPEVVDSTAELDPSTYGVIVTKDWRRGLLLPDLEGIDTPEQQVAIARRKAGIGPEEPVRLERFRVERFH